MIRSGAESVRVEYSDFSTNLPQTIRLTGSPAGRTSSAYDLRLKLSQVEINGSIDAGAFTVQAPRSAVPITLDELRRSGPLGSSPTKSE
jgi:hypothetical protein